MAVAHGVEHPERHDCEAEDQSDGAGDDSDGSFREGGCGVGGCVQGVVETCVDAALDVAGDAVTVDLEPLVELVAGSIDGFGEGVDELRDLVDGDGDDLGADEEEGGGDGSVDEEHGEAASVDVALVGARGDDAGHAIDEW